VLGQNLPSPPTIFGSTLPHNQNMMCGATLLGTKDKEKACHTSATSNIVSSCCFCFPKQQILVRCDCVEAVHLQNCPQIISKIAVQLPCSDRCMLDMQPNHFACAVVNSNMQSNYPCTHCCNPNSIANAVAFINYNLNMKQPTPTGVSPTCSYVLDCHFQFSPVMYRSRVASSSVLQ